MKTSHEENLETLENDILALRQQIFETELMIRYPISGCDRVAWRIAKTDELNALLLRLERKEKVRREWVQQLNLSFAEELPVS